MKTLLLVIGVVILIAIVLTVVLRRDEERDNSGIGFREWVTNPEAREQVAADLAARDSVTIPRDMTDDAIRSLVRQLLRRNPKDEYYEEKLELLGERAVPFLIELLEDPRVGNTFWRDDDFIEDSPFERICSALEHTAPPQAVGALLPYVAHEEDHVRKELALLLGNIGSDGCGAPLVSLLADTDDYVRSYAMMGIERGMSGQRCTPDFLTSVFPALVALVDRSDSSVGGEAPKLLLAMDPSKGRELLLSARFLTSANSELHHTIEALNEAEVTIPLDQLLPLLTELRPHAAEYPFSYMFAASLAAYALNPDDNAETYLRGCLKEKESRVREGACEAIGLLHGIANPWSAAWEGEERREFESLTEPQKLVVSCYEYHGEVNNGGHTQYFVNSSGNNWQYAIEGLKAVGAPRRAEILREACGLFPSKSPPIDREERWNIVGEFFEEKEEALDSLDTRYYDLDGEDVYGLLVLYAVQHKQDFKQAKK